MDMSSEWLRGLRSWVSANDSVLELWLFGSRAQGCSRPESDVDLAVALMPARSKHDDPAYTNYYFSKSEWKEQLKNIVERPVNLDAIAPDMPGPDWDSMVRCFGVCLWSRADTNFSPMPLLMLKRASASRSSSEWSAGDYDVLVEGAVVGRFSLTPDAPQNRQWMWTLIQGQYQDRGHEMTWKAARAAAMAAFAKSWRGEISGGSKAGRRRGPHQSGTAHRRRDRGDNSP
jgi:predicted nucleotidyltransferase